MTDRRLLENFVNQRDQACFAELVARHGGMVYSTARRLAAEDADDVAQAVFLILSQKAQTLLKHENLAGWLYETARYCAANVRRAERRHMAKFHAAHKAVMSNTKIPTENSAMLEKLDQGLSRLPEKYKRVLLLRYLENLSVETTAEQLGLSPAAVMKRSTRGLSRLRSYFLEQGITSTAQGVCSCMEMQIVHLNPLQQAKLASLSGTTEAQAIAGSMRISWILTNLKITAAILLLATAMTVGIYLGLSRSTGNSPATIKQSPRQPATQPVAVITDFTPVPTSHPAILSKAQILSAVQSARSQITDLSVSLSLNSTQNIKPRGTFGMHFDVVKKEEKLYLQIERTLGMHATDPGVDIQEVAYNGLIGTDSHPDNRMASIQTTRPRQCQTQGTGFFDIAMLNDPRGYNAKGYEADSLISLLRSAVSVIRPKMEMVDGKSCYVVDLVFPYSPPGSHDRKFTAWLDPQMGFLPIKSMNSNLAGVSLEFRIEKAAQVLPGLWLPLTGREIS